MQDTSDTSKIVMTMTVETPLWNGSLDDFDEKRMTDIFLSCLAHMTLPPQLKEKSLEISLSFIDDTAIQDLNRDYRGKDKPTNVLSFPQFEDFEGDDMPLTDIDPVPVGDIVMAYETIRKEAEEQKIAFSDHLVHMLVHGFLHLNGYDHETDEEADEMEHLEIKILSDLGIENPYKDLNFVA